MAIVWVLFATEIRSLHDEQRKELPPRPGSSSTTETRVNSPHSGQLFRAIPTIGGVISNDLGSGRARRPCYPRAAARSLSSRRDSRLDRASSHSSRYAR